MSDVQVPRTGFSRTSLDFLSQRRVQTRPPVRGEGFHDPQISPHLMTTIAALALVSAFATSGVADTRMRAQHYHTNY
jgi:hypothetical protein